MDNTPKYLFGAVICLGMAAISLHDELVKENEKIRIQDVDFDELLEETNEKKQNKND